MAQAKKKTATRTAKKTARTTTKKVASKNTKQQQGSNMFFVISMTVLAATLLFADLLMLNA